MKKIFILSTLFLFVFTASVYSASIDVTQVTGSFVVNVLQDNQPVKEINSVVIVPFQTEYSILLKNNNDKRAVAKVTIDGTNISTYGDIVIPAYSDIKLERFITDSLDSGKKFKFVPLTDKNVDDPSREDNGIIRVVFQLEKKREYIKPIELYDIDDFMDSLLLSDEGIVLWSYISDTSNSISLSEGVTDASTFFVADSSAQKGATIGGSESDQKFSKTDIDVDDREWVIELKMLGID